MEAFMGNLVPMVFFATVFGALYVFIQARNRERLAMIERGADASLFESRSSKKGQVIKMAMFIIGAGIGLFIGSLLDKLGVVEHGVAIAASIMIFAGSFLLWGHFIVKSLEKKDML